MIRAVIGQAMPGNLATLLLLFPPVIWIMAGHASMMTVGLIAHVLPSLTKSPGKLETW
jgi:hypothetical protein